MVILRELAQRRQDIEMCYRGHKISILPVGETEELLSERGVSRMAYSNIKAVISSDIRKVWEMVLAVDKYSAWRSDLSKTETVNEKKFIEYTKEGYPTMFTVTVVEIYKRWEFDMENSNMRGHWTGIFISKGNETEIDFTEDVTAKKFFMKPFIKAYLKKQQTQFIMDLKKALE